MMNNICEKLHLFLDSIFDYLYYEKLKKSTKVKPEYYCNDHVIISVSDEDYFNGYPFRIGKRNNPPKN